MPSDAVNVVPLVPGDHKWNWLTYCCEQCGATATAVHEGKRPAACEPGIRGITHQAKAGRLQALVRGPLSSVPFLGKID